MCCCNYFLHQQTQTQKEVKIICCRLCRLLLLSPLAVASHSWYRYGYKYNIQIQIQLEIQTQIQMRWKYRRNTKQNDCIVAFADWSPSHPGQLPVAPDIDVQIHVQTQIQMQIQIQLHKQITTYIQTKRWELLATALLPLQTAPPLTPPSCQWLLCLSFTVCNLQILNPPKC